MINLQEVVDQTIENGGHTVDVGGRYMVALEDYEVIVPLEDFNTSVVKLYSEYSLPKIENVTLGTWVHEGKVYLDASIAFGNLEEAMRVAKENKQLAIFDIETLTEIKVQ